MPDSSLQCKSCRKAPDPIIKSKLLIGDVFLKYTCPGCSPNGQLVLERLPMNWVSIIHLVLYHLHAKDRKAKFFRWKEDICRTIEEHWEDLCPNRNPSGNWMNSISSILSANSNLFESGFNAMGQSAWWALKDPQQAPKALESAQKRGHPTVIEGQAEEMVDVVEGSSPRKSPRKERKLDDEADVQVSLGRPKELKSGAGSPPKLVPKPILPPAKPAGAAALTGGPWRPVTATIVPVPKPQPVPTQVAEPAKPPLIKPAGPLPTPNVNTAADEIKRKLVERLLKVDSELLKQALSKDKAAKAGAPPASGLNPIIFVPPAKPEGAASSAAQPKKKVKPAHYIRASPHENELGELMSKVLNPDERVLRLKRKLAVRKVKRMNGTSLFDLDNWIYLYLKAGNEHLQLLEDSAPRLLEGLGRARNAVFPQQQRDDSLILSEASQAMIQSELSDIPFLKDPTLSFRAKLMGVTHLDGYPFKVVSPYTGAELPNVLYRQTEDLPAKARILRDVVNKSGAEFDDSTHAIEFIHLRKEFLPQVNRLLREYFWPSIDITESLEWPDYSLLVMYRKLVIGCAVCSPEGYLSYLWVHPEWRSAGLAKKLMTLLLMQVLPPTKDVTAHVAVGNPALLLYQSFGFKPEEFIVDFYSKRYHQHGFEEEDAGPNPASRNAFFVRFRR